MKLSTLPSHGQRDYKGVRLVWCYRTGPDEYEFDWGAGHATFAAMSDLYVAEKYITDQIDKMVGGMGSPGYFGSSQLGGQSHGVSRQATQALPSNPLNSLAGIGQHHGLQNAFIQQQIAAVAANAAANSALSQRLQGIQAAPAPPVEPLKTEGIRLGEIIAFRGWRVTPQGFLRSMSANVIWGPGEPMEGKTESKREHNGVYAYKTVKDFLSQHANDLDVYGKVALWGDIIEHELGYRAQFAKIISIEHYLKREAPHQIPIKELRQKYCEAA